MNKNIIYKAIANEQRLMLLRCLEKPKNVTELLDNCTFSQSALSQHLKILRDAGLVKTKKQGKEVFYQCINKKITKIVNLLLDLK